MNKTYLGALLAIIIIGGGYWYVSSNKKSAEDTSESTKSSSYTFGTYAYECDEHVAFTMMPSSDMASLKIAPTTAGAAFPPSVEVWKIGEGNHYEAANLVLRANGETITLGEGDSAINCSPVPSQTEAPFNFGD